MSESIGQWSRVEIAGKGADIYEPAAPSDPTRVIMHLHGHGLETWATKPVYTAELERHGLRAICPHGQRSWWLDRICPEFDSEITPLRFLNEHVTDFIAARWGVEPPMIAVTGISMGGQGALQLAYAHARRFPVVAAISPAVDFHRWHDQGLPLDDMFTSQESARQQTVTLQIHPLNWPRHQLIVCDPADEEWFEGVDRLVGKLYSLGVPFESDLKSTNGGHSWDYFNQMAAPVLSFVVEGLEKESRRE